MNSLSFCRLLDEQEQEEEAEGKWKGREALKMIVNRFLIFLFCVCFIVKRSLLWQQQQALTTLNQWC